MKELIINGLDCLDLLTPCEYEVNYKKRQGKAGGMMLDGSETEDVLAIKAEITLGFIPQNEEALSTFLKRLHILPYAKVKYFDPKNKEYREIEAIYSDIGAKYLFRNIYDEEMWRISTLTLTER